MPNLGALAASVPVPTTENLTHKKTAGLAPSGSKRKEMTSAMTSLQEGSAPGKCKLDAAGERELLIHALRAATARARLTLNTLENISVALRHKRATPPQIRDWLREEGLEQHVARHMRGAL